MREVAPKRPVSGLRRAAPVLPPDPCDDESEDIKDTAGPAPIRVQLEEIEKRLDEIEVTLAGTNERIHGALLEEGANEPGRSGILGTPDPGMGVDQPDRGRGAAARARNLIDA